MATGLERTAVSPHTMQAGQTAPQRPSLAQTAMNPLARAYQLYQQYVGQPFQQAVRGGVRGYFGLPLMTDASSVGREAYRQGEALGFTPGVGMPAGAVRVAAEGMQALPSIAGDIGRVISGLPSAAAARQAEDFAAYQRSIPPSDVSPLTAFHGTPHTFPAEPGLPLGRFRSEKIGSGEGAQAFGYGIYFAENPKVAGGYKAVLSEQPFPDGDPRNGAWNFLNARGEDAARKYLETSLPKDQVESALMDVKNASSGSLYTVDIPDAMVDKMLDWDKPLKGQSQSVLEALSSKTGVSVDTYRQSDKTGKQVWQTWISRRGNPQEAAAALQEIGIPGIRYLDQSSRAGGEGTRNIVVLPGEEQNVKILSRE
jgi:hypothetical protein